ncbi:hypothetical protein X737_36870 [Mesorhizobium sp. L48C026A00]|nr:hypothetical protein X737_36870 [Mesorhizobium sp. L48C026A00]
MVVRKARRDRNLLEELEKGDAALDSQPSVVPLLLVLYVLSMLGFAAYAIAGWYLP